MRHDVYIPQHNGITFDIIYIYVTCRLSRETIYSWAGNSHPRVMNTDIFNR